MPSSTTTPTSTLHILSLPTELRNRIYTLALDQNPLPARPYSSPAAPIPDLSLLLTNRQIYNEARGLPLQLYGVGREFIPSTPTLGFLRSWQVANLRRLAITYIYPTYLGAFTGYNNGYVFGESELHLDTLLIYADKWLTRSNASRWRNVTHPTDVYHGLPHSPRWLLALCNMKGWKQLDIEFRECEMEAEYWEGNAFLQPLLENFRQASLCPADAAGNGRSGTEFTVWHKQDDTPFNEKITVLRTAELRSHGSPEWAMGDLGTLVRGEKCVLAEKRREREEAGPHDQGLQGEWRPDFHVAERGGEVKGREGWCAWCHPRLKE